MEPKVCLALGGGAARGLAHLGVLKVFEEAKLPAGIGRIEDLPCYREVKAREKPSPAGSGAPRA